jgi:hypothetical protein
MSQDDVEPAGAATEPPDDDGGMYGVFGEGKPRHILGDSDEPPRRRPRKKRDDGTSGAPATEDR